MFFLLPIRLVKGVSWYINQPSSTQENHYFERMFLPLEDQGEVYSAQQALKRKRDEEGLPQGGNGRWRGISELLKPEKFTSGQIPSPKVVAKLCDKFEQEGKFVAHGRKKGAYKMTSPVKQKAREKLKAGNSLRRTEGLFLDERKGVQVRVKKDALHKFAKKELELARPKQEKVILTPHHKRFRVLYSEERLDKSDDHVRHTIFADATGIGMQIKPNRQVNSKWVERGHASFENIQAISSQDTKNATNLFVLLSKGGVENSHVYRGEFDADLYGKTLIPAMAPAVRRLKAAGEFSVYAHDHCLKGNKPVAALNKTFGQGKWGTTPAPPCKTRVGGKSST